MMKVEVSIAICTYNRPKELSLCLTSILQYSGDFINKLEVLIVDNGLSNETKNIVSSFKDSLPIKYIPCESIGLSYARNVAAKSSLGGYIFYLDDDAKLMPSTLSNIFQTIECYNFDIFGGGYVPYYHLPPPSWLPVNFGYSNFKQKSIGLAIEPIHGGVMIIKKNVLDNIRFDTSFGMKGKEIGYGEESQFQIVAQKAGFKVGYNPNVIVEHLVAQYKYSLIWQLKSIYYKGYYSDFKNLKLIDKAKIISKDVFIYIPIGIIVAVKELVIRRFDFKRLVCISSFSIVSFLGRILGCYK